MKARLYYVDSVEVEVNPDNYESDDDLVAAIRHEAEVKAGKGFTVSDQFAKDMCVFTGNTEDFPTGGDTIIGAINVDTGTEL